MLGAVGAVGAGFSGRAGLEGAQLWEQPHVGGSRLSWEEERGRCCDAWQGHAASKLEERLTARRALGVRSLAAFGELRARLTTLSQLSRVAAR